MAEQFIKNTSNRILILAIFVFAIYSNARIIAANYALNQALIEKRAVLSQLNENSAKLKLLLSYYESDDYQNVEARRRLGLKMPDEKAYAIKGIELTEIKPDEIEPVIYKQEPQEAPKQENNLKSWADYFFK